jgi:alpha-tubulin suppressor-like RCC1 family protein
MSLPIGSFRHRRALSQRFLVVISVLLVVLGGGLFARAVLVRPAHAHADTSPQRLETFVNTNGTLQHRWSDDGGTTWSTWTVVLSPHLYVGIPDSVVGTPALVSDGPTHLIVAVRDSNDVIWITTSPNWSGWSTIPGSFGGGVEIKRDCNIIACNYFDDYAFSSEPALTSWGPGRMDLFAYGTDTQTGTEVLLHTWADNDIWTGTWEDLGTAYHVQGAPAAASVGPGHIDVFGRGENNELEDKWFANGSWHTGWDNQGGTLASNPAVTSTGSGLLNVFAVNASDGHLWGKTFAGTWGNWVDWGCCLARDVATPVAVVSLTPGALDEFEFGVQHALYHFAYTNAGGWGSGGFFDASFNFTNIAAAIWTPTTSGGVYSWDCLNGDSGNGIPYSVVHITNCPSPTPNAALANNVIQLANGKAKMVDGSINNTDCHFITFWATCPDDAVIGDDNCEHLCTYKDGIDFEDDVPLFSAAVLADGSVDTWGYNTFGDLGSTPPPNSSATTPVPVSGLTGITQISLGYQHAVALRNDGTVWTWGANYNGQLGSGSFDSQSHPTPQQVPGLAGIVQVAAGQDFSLALRNDGTVWVWGSWDGPNAYAPTATPSRIDLLTGIVQIAAGYWHMVALRDDGTVWGYGYTRYGQAGPATDGVNTPDPFQITGLPSPVTKIAAGFSQSLAIAGPNHSVYAWGDDGLNEGPDPDENIGPIQNNCDGPVTEAPFGVLHPDGIYGCRPDNTYIYQPDGISLAQPNVHQVLSAHAIDISADFAAWGALLSDGSVWTWNPGGWVWSVSVSNGVSGSPDVGPFQQPTGGTSGVTQLVLAPVDWGNQACHESSGTCIDTAVRPMILGAPMPPPPTATPRLPTATPRPTPIPTQCTHDPCILPK